MPTRERTQAEGLDWVTWLGAGLLLACTAILSFTTLADLAARGAYMDWRRWLWPLSVDLTRLPQAPLPLAVKPGVRQALARPPVTAGLDLALVDKARELIAASERAPGGRRIGRQALAAELGTSPHQARLQLAHYDTTPAPGADAPDTEKEPARA